MTKPQTRLADPAAANVRAATVAPASWSEADRSFEVCFTTGAAVTRFDWWDGGFYEETLEVTPGAVRLDRLQQGGPVLRDHITSTRELVGSVVPGSVRLDGGQGFARLRLADTPEAADIVALVRDGHLRSVSVGYLVHQYTRIEREGERPIMRADDWEPVEVSLTPVPADPGAHVRSKPSPTSPNGDPDMTRILAEDGTPINSRSPADNGGALYRGGSPNRARLVTTDQILRACHRANLPREVERRLLEENERSPLNEAQLFDQMIDLVGEQRNTSPINANRAASGSAGSLREAFSDALYARLSGREPSPAARDYVGASLTDFARALLEARGEPVRWLRASAVVDAITRSGQHTASDFSFILESAARRFLLDSFGSAASPLKPLARPRTLPDFRVAYGVQAEGPAILREVAENGEFKRVTFTERAEPLRLRTFGDIFGISRKALVNDDLQVFSDMARFFARAAAETEASMLVDLISGNGAVMADGKTLFHADHGNIASEGAGIDEASLSAARAAMRTMLNLDGTTYANVTPKYLVVGAQLETQAEKVLAQLAPASIQDANPFSGRLELLVDPRLSGASWRLFADPVMHPVIEHASLEGQEGLYTESRLGFDVDGVEMKARIDIGAAVMDFRGAFLNPGAAVEPE